MTNKSKVSRRDMLAASAGLTATVVSAAVFAGERIVTPAQTEGPFYPNKPQADKDTDLTLIEGHSERAKGEVVRVTGRVLDQHGAPVAGALVDLWQANAAGRYDHEADPATAPLDPNFQSWGMVRTDADGRYAFTTIKPGAYPVDGTWSRPPHIHFKVSRRGYREITTQMYFAGEPLNDVDRLLQEVPEAERAALVVKFEPVDDVPQGNFEVVLAKA